MSFRQNTQNKNAAPFRALDIVSFYQTKNVIKESWHLKDTKQFEYGSLQKYTYNK